MKRFILAGLFTGSIIAHAAEPAATENAKQEEDSRAARLRWFHEAKYGLFINWGLYAIPAGEWKGKPIRGIGEWIMHNARIPVKEYELLAKQFNPVKFKDRKSVV